MAKNQVSTPAAPAAIGPYSQGITATGTAVYVSGQLPIDPATGAFAGDDITSQTRQSLENVKAVLAAADYELSDVVKTTVLLKDIADFGAMNEVYASYFTGVCPARSAFQVAALPKGARVEIEAAVTKNPKRTIPLGIIIITLLLAVIYGAMGIVAGGVLPYAETAGQNISVTARAIFPNALYVFFVVGGGIGAIASSALGGLGMFRYPLLQVANDGWLPSVFKKTDKNGYPYAIYLLFYVISVFPIVTGRSLDAIVSQVMIPAMLINIYMNLACLTLPKKYPEQWAQRSIKMPLWFYNICCVLGAFCAGVVAYNLFKDLTFNDAVFAVVIVVVLCALSILRLKQGAVKAEDLAAKKEEIVRQAIADTTADEAKAA